MTALVFFLADLRTRMSQNLKQFAPRKGGAMEKRYRLNRPILALYDQRENRLLRVTLPAGSMLIESVQHSSTLLGMVGVYWEGRHYSVALSDLRQKTDRVQTA
jgi:hypothetical protein